MYEYKYSDKEMLPNPTFEKAYLMILQFIYLDMNTKPFVQLFIANLASQVITMAARIIRSI